MVTPGHKVLGQDSIVLLTKYKNMDAYLEGASALRNGLSCKRTDKGKQG